MGMHSDDEDSVPVEAHAEEGEGLWLVSYADMMTLLCGFFIILLSFAKIDDGALEELKRETTKVFGGEYQRPFEDLAKRIQDIVDKSGVADQVIVTDKGSGVEIAFRGGLFFESGTAEPNQKARELVSDLISELKKEKEQYFYLIEGHTDGIPIRSKIFPSNWELSSVRACSVLRLFEEAGFLPEKLKAVGYADTRKVAEEKLADGNINAAALDANRRVVIKILRRPDS